MILKPSFKPVFSQKGFTLLEIIVSLIVASILGSMFLVYIGTAYNKSVEPVILSKRIQTLEGYMEDINAIYAGLLNKNNLLDTFNSEITTYKSTLPTGINVDSSKRFDFPASRIEPDASDPFGNILKVVIEDTNTTPNLKITALFYASK